MKWMKLLVKSSERFCIACAGGALATIISVVLASLLISPMADFSATIEGRIGYSNNGDVEWLVSVFRSPGKVLVRSTLRQPPSTNGGYATSVPHPYDIIPRWSGLTGDHDFAGVPGIEGRTLDARGWPLVCMRMEYARTEQGWHVVDGLLTSFRNDFDPRDPWPLAAAIPLRPMWGRCVANTVFWAALIFVGMWIRTFVVTASRRARSACAACGYPAVRRCSACPECGAAYSCNISDENDPIVDKVSGDRCW